MPRSRTTPAAPRDQVVALLDQEVGAEHRGELAQRRHLALDLALDRARSGGFTQSRSSPVPSRCAERQARRTRRCEEGWGRTSASSALADRLRGLGGDALLAGCPAAPRPTRRLASTPGRPGGARAPAGTEGSRSVEEVLQGARTLEVLKRIDLPGAQLLEQSLDGQVDEHQVVGLAEHRVGQRPRGRGCRSALTMSSLKASRDAGR